VAESDGLENRCGCMPTVGSNPTPSAGGQPPAGQACPPLPAARQDCGQAGLRPGRESFAPALRLARGGPAGGFARHRHPATVRQARLS